MWWRYLKFILVEDNDHLMELPELDSLSLSNILNRFEIPISIPSLMIGNQPITAFASKLRRKAGKLDPFSKSLVINIAGNLDKPYILQWRSLTVMRVTSLASRLFVNSSFRLAKMEKQTPHSTGTIRLRGETLKTSVFPAQRASTSESVSKSWDHPATDDDRLLASVNVMNINTLWTN